MPAVPAVIDTCGWIEWLTDGVLVTDYEPWLTDLSQVYVPTSIQYELYKWVKREHSEVTALEVIALTEQGITVSLDTSISLLAADLAVTHNLSFADSIIYATAQQMDVQLITSDSHFEGLSDVIYFNKQTPKAD